MTIFREVEIEVKDLTPAELAKEFCEWDSDFQAIFFNAIYTEQKSWRVPFCFQLQRITESILLSKEGREVMRQIGEYSERSS